MIAVLWRLFEARQAEGRVVGVTGVVVATVLHLVVGLHVGRDVLGGLTCACGGRWASGESGGASGAEAFAGSRSAGLVVVAVALGLHGSVGGG
jgi:hypothetical protein